MSAKTAAVQGSGWGWLGFNKEKDRVEIATCANQDPLSTTGLVPLFGIDVWEHAYYLQYKNVRPDYVRVRIPVSLLFSLLFVFVLTASESCCVAFLASPCTAQSHLERRQL